MTLPELIEAKERVLDVLEARGWPWDLELSRLIESVDVLIIDLTESAGGMGH